MRRCGSPFQAPRLSLAHTTIDIVERFTLALMLCVVAFRNLIELSGSQFDFPEGGFLLPKSFGWFRGDNVLWTISYVRIIYAKKKKTKTLNVW
jgi:hypothetical protein